MDLAVGNADVDTVAMLLGYGNGAFGRYQAYSTRPNSSGSIAISDLNGDQYLDIAVAYFNTNKVGVLIGYGNGTFGKQITFVTGSPSAPDRVAVHDFNEDDCADIVVSK